MARGNKRDGNPHADLPMDDTPVDVMAVRRDDAFIESLAGNGNVATETPEQYDLALMLADWREGIVSAPMPAGPNLDEVVAAIEKTNRTSTTRSRMRLLRPVAGAAAAIAVVMGGATIFSYNAQPGDPLWNVKEVVFSQYADSTVARIDTTSQLQQAERLIASGDAESAREALGEAAARTDDVRDADTRSELHQWRDRLSDELKKLRPEPTPSVSVVPPPSAPGSTSKAPPSDPTTSGAEVPGMPGTDSVPWQDLLPSELQIPPILPPPESSTPPAPSTELPPVDPSTVPPTEPVDPTVMLVPSPDGSTPTPKGDEPAPTTTTTPPPAPGN